VPEDEEESGWVRGTSQDGPPPPNPDGSDGPDLGEIDDWGEGGGSGGGGSPDLEDPGHEQD
jgi:hypothetical protein